MGYLEERQVAWVDASGLNFSDFYPDEDSANYAAKAIAENATGLTRIWLQGRTRMAGVKYD